MGGKKQYRADRHGGGKDSKQVVWRYGGGNSGHASYHDGGGQWTWTPSPKHRGGGGGNGPRLPRPQAPKPQAAASVGASTGTSAPSAEDAAFIASLREQIRAVEAVVRVAKGDHLAMQNEALDKLRSQLALACTKRDDGKQPSQRRVELERAISDVRTKLDANKLRLAEAQSQVVTFQGFVASQSTRLDELESKLSQLLAAPLVTSADPDEQGILDKMAAAQRELHDFREARAKRTPSPLQLPAPDAGNDAYKVLSDADLEMGDEALDKLFGNDQLDEPAKVRRRDEQRKYISSHRKDGNRSDGSVKKLGLKA